MTRNVDPNAWGKVILEDILFRAAKAASSQPAGSPPADVTLTFTLAADPETGEIEIATPGAVEPVITTRLKLA